MWIEIFRIGKQTDSAGNSYNYTQNDLDQIVNKYNDMAKISDSYEAPIVLGHPEADEPAYGWVKQLERRGDLLYAELKDLSPEFDGLIEKKLYKKVSIALYKDLTLKHIGLLGAVPPAVKGLVNVNFSDKDNTENLIYYSQELVNITTDIENNCETNCEKNCEKNNEALFVEKNELLNKITTLEGELNKFRSNQIKSEFKHKLENKFITEYNISLNKNERDLLYDSIDNLLNDIDLRFENNDKVSPINNQFSENLFNSISNILMVYNQSINHSFKAVKENNTNLNTNLNTNISSNTNSIVLDNDLNYNLNYSISDNIESKNSNYSNFNEYDFPNFDHKYLGKNTNIQAKKLALHNKIIELAKAQNVSYEEAISLL